MTLLLSPSDVLGQQVELADDWRPRNVAEAKLFDVSGQLLVAARVMERASGAPRSAGATDVSLRFLQSALGSLANASLMIRAEAAADLAASSASDFERQQGEELGRLLFGVTQNLRLAAEGCRQSRDAVPSPAV